MQLEVSGRLEEACTLFQTALKLKPKNLELREYVAQKIAEVNDRTAAQRQAAAAAAAAEYRPETSQSIMPWLKEPNFYHGAKKQPRGKGAYNRAKAAAWPPDEGAEWAAAQVAAQAAAARQWDRQPQGYDRERGAPRAVSPPQYRGGGSPHPGEWAQLGPSPHGGGQPGGWEGETGWAYLPQPGVGSPGARPVNPRDPLHQARGAAQAQYSPQGQYSPPGQYSPQAQYSPRGGRGVPAPREAWGMSPMQSPRGGVDVRGGHGQRPYAQPPQHQPRHHYHQQQQQQQQQQHARGGQAQGGGYDQGNAVGHQEREMHQLRRELDRKQAELEQLRRQQAG